jgi:ribonuclease J
MVPGEELLFCALGGSGEIGMNVNLYGCRGQWIMVGLGLNFAGPDYPGIELILPDLEFIEDQQERLAGIILTHGHEDHIGALPYLAEELKSPLFATPFTAGLIAGKLEEEGLTGAVKLNIVERGGSIELGPFKVSFVALSHSIPEGNGLLIETPFGSVFHTGDWKIDETPVIGEGADTDVLTQIGDRGVLALVCDSTNVFNPESSGSEGEVYRGLLEEVARHRGRRVVVTTFASNVARLQTLGRVAQQTGRELCVAGRSLDRMIEVAQANGYLLDFPEPVDWDTAMALPRGKVLILATGGQGEPRAALARIAEGQHPLSLTEGDVVLFSSRTIPGNEIAIGKVQNLLAEHGVQMVSDRQSMIHVSGHPGRPELEALYGWLRPEILVPVHGEIRHMQEQARLGAGSGIPDSVFQKNGDIVRLAPGRPGKLAEVRAGRLVLDGDIVVPADGEAITTRRRLAHNGLVIVALDGKGGAQVHGLGLPLDEDYPEFVAEAEADVAEAIAKLKGADARDPAAREEAARLAARRAAQRWSGKKPQTKVILAG